MTKTAHNNLHSNEVDYDTLVAMYIITITPIYFYLEQNKKRERC